MSLGHKISQLLLGMCSSNKHKIMPKWGIFNVSVRLNEHGKFQRKSIVSVISEELAYAQETLVRFMTYFFET